MFSFFKSKKKLPAYSYHTYQTDFEKYWMLVQDLLAQSKESKILLVHYFDDTRTELVKLMEKAGLEFNVNQTSFQAGVNINLVSYDEALNNSLFSEYNVWSAEVFPVWSLTTKFLECHKEASKIIFFTSMESPFFDLFGGERLKTLMKNLGMKENEKIQHQMIDKSIERAQQKLEEKAQNINIKTSFEDWMAQNHSS